MTPTVVRGLTHRASTTALMLLVAVVAVAAATAGPTYYRAGQTSILADTLTSAPVIGRSIEVVQSGSLAGAATPLATQTTNALDADVGPAARRVFATPVLALEGSGLTTDQGIAANEDVPLVWRSAVCTHLRIDGECPTEKSQVIISRSLATTDGWHLGQQIGLGGWGGLVVVGIYAPPTRPGTYWGARSGAYFPYEEGGGQGASYDAMFTALATINAAGAQPQGNVVVDEPLAPAAVRPADVGVLRRATPNIVDDPVFDSENATVTSSIATTMSTVQTAWSSLSIPALVITAQVLGLAWLLLFLLVGDSVDARGPEIALVKLRGWRRLRVVGFGLSEPIAVMAAALPIGALAGWGATVALAGTLMRHGTAVGLPGIGWAAAAAATAGGLGAVALAARRVMTRPVTEQWRRTGRHATRRGWVLDTILLVAAAGGLVELGASGQVSSTGGGAGHRVLTLLVPGLLGLAVAVVASRLLPLACRAGMRLTAGRRSLATYLALRQVGRRPAGTRTTMLLGTSFALATFALSSWLVGQSNYQRVADARSGAATVLTVSIPTGNDLASVVQKADPGGRQAAGVEALDTGGNETLAVQPARFAAVAAWGPGASRPSPAALAAALHPAYPAPIVLNGSALQVELTVHSLTPSPGQLVADVVTPSDEGPTPVALGTLPVSGPATLSAPLPGCPCTLRDLQVSLISPGLSKPPPERGSITFGALDQCAASSCAPVPGALTDARHWQSDGGQIASSGPGNLAWQFTAAPGSNPTFTVNDHPMLLPALFSKALGPPGARPSAPGLDGRALPVQAVASVGAVPGAPADGIVVDRSFAQLAAGGDDLQASDQIWVAHGAAPAIRSSLARQGVTVVSSVTAAAATSMLARQGPGLASVLFLADAGAAALLAAIGAIASLYAFARRRRYEYAALEVSGVKAPTLRRSLLGEQIVVLGFGTLAGIAAGAAAVAAALSAVPELLTVPAAPTLSYTPAIGPLAGILAAMLALLIVVAGLSTVSVVRGVRLEQLREAGE